jgi:osmotically-inducible protein OsmY
LRQYFPDTTLEEFMNNKALRQHVLEELEFEPSIDPAAIGVVVENGVVTLSGHVPSYWQKTAAEAAVWRVKGVKAIAQEIQVRFQQDKKHADDQIAERAVKLLDWDILVPKNAIRVKVQQGHVTLEGEVAWQFERRAVEENVRKLSGVVGVFNNIVIKPEMEAIDVRKSIENALKRYAELQSQRIRIDVRENGVVVLDGEVDSWEELQAVERAAWSVPGVRTVETQLTIV